MSDQRPTHCPFGHVDPSPAQVARVSEAEVHAPARVFLNTPNRLLLSISSWHMLPGIGCDRVQGSKTIPRISVCVRSNFWLQPFALALCSRPNLRVLLAPLAPPAKGEFPRGQGQAKWRTPHPPRRCGRLLRSHRWNRNPRPQPQKLRKLVFL